MALATTRKMDITYDRDKHGHHVTIVRMDDLFSHAQTVCEQCGTSVITHDVMAVPTSMDNHACQSKYCIVKQVVCAATNRFF